MQLPVNIIEGAKLMERWGMLPVDLVMMMMNRRLVSVHKEIGEKGWIDDDYDAALWFVLKDKHDISEFIFKLPDVSRLEKEYGELTSESNKLLRGKELMKRWDKTVIEICDMMDRDFLEAVDPVGVSMDSPELENLISSGYATEADFLFRMDDVGRLEQKYPELRALEQNEISPPDIQRDDGEPQEETDPDNVPIVSFYKNGQFWRIGEKGKEREFRDLKGFEFIRFLISHPKDEFNALEVYYCGNVPDEFKRDDYQKVSDPETVQKVLTYKGELEEELGEADSPEDAEAIQAKIDQCEDFLAKSRNGFKNNSSQIRSTVRKRIKAAIKTIEREAKEYPSLRPLTKYLSLENPNKRIKTGNNLWYRQDPSNEVKWVLDTPNP